VSLDGSGQAFGNGLSTAAAGDGYQTKSNKRGERERGVRERDSSHSTVPHWGARCRGGGRSVALTNEVRFRYYRSPEFHRRGIWRWLLRRGGDDGHWTNELLGQRHRDNERHFDRCWAQPLAWSGRELWQLGGKLLFIFFIHNILAGRIAENRTSFKVIFSKS
jgi:hypothetical protein